MENNFHGTKRSGMFDPGEGWAIVVWDSCEQLERSNAFKATDEETGETYWYLDYRIGANNCLDLIRHFG